MSKALLAAVSVAGLFFTGASYAHGGAGDREFPATLLTDDPAVKDEISVPTLVHLRENNEDGSFEHHESDANFELDRTLTENLGIAINTGYTRLHQADGTSINGWENLSTTLKYQYMVNAPHEFTSSIGITRTWGNTGSKSIADEKGSTEPTFYFGKGLGDLPIGLLRPLAITGTIGVNIPDSGADDVRTLDTGLAIEYSIPYLQDQVDDYGLPGWVSRLVPLVEFTYSRPTDRNSNVPMLGTIAPGVIYTSKNWQLGVEALLPATSASPAGRGFQVQLHIFFGELFPDAFGKPVF